MQKSRYLKKIMMGLSVVSLLVVFSMPAYAATKSKDTNSHAFSNLATLVPSTGGGGGTSGSVSQGCNKSSSNFLSFPTWYEYLPLNATSTGCQPAFTSISDVWLIVAAIIDILLRIGAIVAVGMVIYGGIMYTISSGSAENVTKAKTIIINSMIGLAISITATAVITFIAGSIH